MKVYLATDHAGFELKEQIKIFLVSQNYEVIDCGAKSFNPDDDYPDFISVAANMVSKDPDNSRGIIFGGSGQAEMMTANKFKNVRCALFYSTATPISAADISGRESSDPLEIIRLTREHNNSNMLSIAARFVTEELAKQAVSKWLAALFTNEKRHARRIEKIKEIEKNLDK